MKRKLVRCIRATGNHRVGKICTVIEESRLHYDDPQNPSGKVYAFSGEKGMRWFADWFEDVDGCPCSVKNCIAKHKA